MEIEMKEYSTTLQRKALKAIAILLASTFLQVSVAYSGNNGGGLGGTLGGALGGLGNAVGGATGAVGNTANGITGKVGNTTTKLGALNKQGALTADARSDILNGVIAKARVLSPKALAKLCLNVGGGDKGCGSGGTPQILGLVDVRLNALTDSQLVSVCASVGGGCGGGANVTSGGDGVGNAGIDNMSRSEIVAYKKRCKSILSSPQQYGDDMVSICKLIKRQKI
jgi:hypothetical protein